MQQSQSEKWFTEIYESLITEFDVKTVKFQMGGRLEEREFFILRLDGLPGFQFYCPSLVFPERLKDLKFEHLGCGKYKISKVKES